jgi:hypothetical protein
LSSAAPDAIILAMSDGNLHRIEDELGERWLEEWAVEGVLAIEAYLAKHQAFQSFLENDQPV